VINCHVGTNPSSVLLTKLAIILLPRETSDFENIPGKRKSDKVPK